MKKSAAVQVHYSKCENTAVMLLFSYMHRICCGSFEASEVVAVSLCSVSFEIKCHNNSAVKMSLPHPDFFYFV